MTLMIYILFVAMVIFVGRHTRLRITDNEPEELEWFKRLFAEKPI